MAYNTIAIKKDVDGKPIPQYYNDLQDAYEVLKGRNGASRVELYDASGNPVDLASLINALADLLTAIKDTAGIKKIADALPAGTNNIGKVTVDGSTMEYYGASLNDRPPANTVQVGAIFVVVGNYDVIYQSNGTDWVVIS
ncbi:MAG TPA: hypothetical protein GXX14_04665 [Clostridiaceae bacterium]|nr:hypothetical protein [Clostridiaceae bacterium]